MKHVDLHLLSRLRLGARAAAWLATACWGVAFAASTDISNAPLFTSTTNVVKPNIMFVLDDSGSMASNFMPDDANNFNGSYGFVSSQCNGLAYDPTVTYTLPVDYTGTSVSAPSTTYLNPPGGGTAVTLPSWPTAGSQITISGQSGWSGTVAVYTSSGFFYGTVASSGAGGTVINVIQVSGTQGSSPKLSTSLPSHYYYAYTGSQTKLGFTYTSSGVITTTTFYKECNSNIGSTPGKNVFTKMYVTSVSSDGQNYANWDNYYDTRIHMMKTAMSLAFKAVDSRYRVGFTTISNNKAAGSNFLDINDFDTPPTNGGQKAKFYAALNAANAAGNTPLRGALAKAGQYYANKAPSQSKDPIQYSCQRNYTIMSTDGYWNTGAETSTYTSNMVDNATKVGQQDGGNTGTPRPMFDGNTVSVTTTTKWTTTAVTQVQTATPTMTVSTTTRNTTTTAPLNSNAGMQRTLYTAVPVIPESGNDMSRSGNVVTVTTSQPHGLKTGDTISVTGTSFFFGFPFFDTSYQTSGATITVLSPTSFSYASTGSNGSARGNYDITPGGSSLSCPAGNSVQRASTQTADQVNITSTSFTSTTTSYSTSTVVQTVTVKTPWTEVVTTQNGQVSSDTKTAGAFTTSTQSSTPSVTSTTPVTTTATSTTSGAGTSTWVTTSSTALSCQPAPPNPNPAPTATNLPSTTSATTNVTGPTTTGPTATVGQVVTTTLSSTSTDTTHISSSTSNSTGGATNTLADIAMYYYQTDLRDSAPGLNNCTGALGTNVCTNNVPGNTSDAAHSYGDSATWQHMTLFTMSLGAGGLLDYDPNYLTQKSGDYFDITNGSKDWPVPQVSSNGGGPENIDDLWHAAVNGRGQYFSAKDPTSLANGLNSALNAIKAVTGAASAASTSSLQPVQGDNDIYVAQFTTQLWVGDVLSYKIDPTTGSISSTPTWSAKAQLDSAVPANRTIYYADPAGGSTLHTFTYANLTTDGYNTYFDGFCSKTGASGAGAPQQCGTLSGPNTTAANTGSNLVNYLRGDQTMSYYRTRNNLLGDIINASPLFVGKPAFKYTENNYGTFATNNASRQAVVLAAANDGMLHAFDRTTGRELWAFVPKLVMPNLYKLADNNYANNHSYFVDGSPQMGDIFVNGAWKTIVVGGLNAGGRGYYALDVTDPASPKMLWQFTNDNLGLSFGNPIITKRADGTWVVVVASGYNNVSPGDGNGHLFVLDANTGSLLLDEPTYTSGTTPAGDTTTPSGLAKINDWVDSELNNQAMRFYGGDNLGNLWRFDIDGNVAPNNSALLLAQLTGPTPTPNGTPQPITSKPALASVNYNGSSYPVVYVATGRYLGLSDITDMSVQSVYAIKDPLAATPYGAVRNNSNFVAQTITPNGTARTTSSNAVNWLVKSGWYADLPAGERVSVSPQIALQTLFIGSNLPSTDSCTVGGQSFLYQFDIGTGSATSYYVGNVMVQGLTLVQLTTGAASGSVVSIITRSDGSLQTEVTAPSAGTANLKRTSWRELVD